MAVGGGCRAGRARAPASALLGAAGVVGADLAGQRLLHRRTRARRGVVTTLRPATPRPRRRASAGALPWPIQAHELVDVAVGAHAGGRLRAAAPSALKEALMLTDDENIVDIQFAVQYRIKDDGADATTCSTAAARPRR
ncbi:MAG: hypothetical protein MZW92_04080 [Comamonadaceae bacterium]|nr:hypothetical protein [Comamonadaceae bacterium]